MIPRKLLCPSHPPSIFTQASQPNQSARGVDRGQVRRGGGGGQTPPTSAQMLLNVSEWLWMVGWVECAPVTNPPANGGGAVGQKMKATGNIGEQQTWKEKWWRSATGAAGWKQKCRSSRSVWRKMRNKRSEICRKNTLLTFAQGCKNETCLTCWNSL